MNHNELAHLCGRSYKDHTFRIQELEVLLEYTDGVYYLAIRGTESGGLISEGGIRDVIRDLRVIPSRHNYLGWCHSGFLKGALAISRSGWLRQELKDDAPIVVTGHSLGAGVGQLLALILHSEGYNVRNFVGFGMPRCFIGNRDFDLDIVHYRCMDDIVSNIPHRWFFHYRHAVPWEQLKPATGTDSWRTHHISWYKAYV